MGRMDFSLTEYNSEPQQTWNFVKTLWNKLYFAQKSHYKINDIIVKAIAVCSKVHLSKDTSFHC